MEQRAVLYLFTFTLLLLLLFLFRFGCVGRKEIDWCPPLKMLGILGSCTTIFYRRRSCWRYQTTSAARARLLSDRFPRHLPRRFCVFSFASVCWCFFSFQTATHARNKYISTIPQCDSQRKRKHNIIQNSPLPLWHVVKRLKFSDEFCTPSITRRWNISKVSRDFVFRLMICILLRELTLWMQSHSRFGCHEFTWILFVLFRSYKDDLLMFVLIGRKSWLSP